MEYWYTLYTKPNAEYQVAAALTERNIQIYLPEIESGNPDKGREKKPFFPCYLFMKVNLNVMGLSTVQWTPGLRRVIAFAGQPVPLGDNIIELIRLKLGEIESEGEQAVHTFKPGDPVRIADGPFKDMVAIFDQETSPGERVQVLLQFLGHASKVHIDVANLDKAPDAAQVEAPKRPRRTRGGGRRIKSKE